MDMYHAYNNLRKKKEAILDQINITKHEIYVWYGVDLDEEIGVPGGKSARKHGMNAALIQLYERIDYVNTLERLLESVQFKINRLEMFLSSLEGLEYEIAYRRIVEGKRHEIIAEELQLSYGYVRNLWHKIGGTRLDLNSLVSNKIENSSKTKEMEGNER